MNEENDRKYIPSLEDFRTEWLGEAKKPEATGEKLDIVEPGGKGTNNLLQPLSYLSPGGKKDVIYKTESEFVSVLSDPKNHIKMLQASTDPSSHKHPQFKAVALALGHIAMMAASIKSGNSAKLDESIIEPLHSTNLVKLLEKNYGEILSALYFCNNSDWKHLASKGNAAVNFPAAQQTPLVDFYFYGHGVSVKDSSGGAAPSFFSTAKIALANKDVRDHMYGQALKDKSLKAILDVIEEKGLPDAGKPTFWSKFFLFIDALGIQLKSLELLASVDKGKKCNKLNPFAGYKPHTPKSLKDVDGSTGSKTLTGISNPKIWEWMNAFIAEVGGDKVEAKLLGIFKDSGCGSFSTSVDDGSGSYTLAHCQAVVLLEAGHKMNEPNGLAHKILMELLTRLNIKQSYVTVKISKNDLKFDVKSFDNAVFKWHVKANASRVKDINLNFLMAH